MIFERLCYFLLITGLFCGVTGGYAQETFPRNDVLDDRAEAFAFSNATIIEEPGKKIENGTLLIRDGKIEELGQDVAIPDGYHVIDLTGKSIYPSFIDLHTTYGVPKSKRQEARSRREQIQPSTRGAYSANDAIKSHFKASREFSIDPKEAKKFREAGFGTLLTLREDGIARGTATLVTLGESTPNKEMLIMEAAAEYSLNRGTSTQNYPRSIMGYISLLRQSHLDANWYQSLKHKKFTDQSLESWIANQTLPQIFDAGNWINALRADKVGDEFGINYIIKGGGNEYQRIDQIRSTDAALIIPVNFPLAFEVKDPLETTKISYKDMLHWELAPTNPGLLFSNGIKVAITSHGLKNPKDLLPNLRKAMKHGLSKENALKALTTIPAELVKADHLVGRLRPGMLANFLITNRGIFEENVVIHENWIQGRPYRIKDLDQIDYRGAYTLLIGDQDFKLVIDGALNAQKAHIELNDSTSIPVTAEWDKETVNYNFHPPNGKPILRISGWKTSNGWQGKGKDANGSWIDWSAVRTSNNQNKSLSDNILEQDSVSALGGVIFPFLAHGVKQLPAQKDLIIRNATVWTNEADGILTDMDVLIKRGKISKIGKDLSSEEAMIIDATDKHLTAGIIDEHTHIAGGGNDWATNSSMVRIGDQLNSEDINIYRGLAGGVTAAQVLHGSANPIGGQSALIKLRWGAAPDDLKIKEADAFIKFALGENVKRSSNAQSIRFPQTRMGVEQVYVDAFTNAQEYEKEWNQYHTLSDPNKKQADRPRRDLVHEAMLEILHKERFITCHSYVQSEINMLMKVAEDFDFRINTFTHILEGYKVADKMKNHGVAASSFSDWWNYKWEVRYAIPYNAAILTREGVVTAINSDDANMGRRLNQEAAKSIKYGGLSEEEALKLVTLNPAKMLHLDHRMGSIKEGKDADLVLWSDHPLSVYARAEKTMVDGIIYFDAEEDRMRREELSRDRARLVQKMVDHKKAGGKTQRASSQQNMLIHCESILGEANDKLH